jgi:enamine deaminase RidA (YjgF/YER057c/UK114 family)
VTAVEDRLREAGFELPPVPPRRGTYVGFVRSGSLLFLAGQGSEEHKGRVGAELDVEAGRRAARDSMLWLLAHAKDGLGSLDRVARVVKVLGFVACTEDFRDTPRVMDGGSEVLHIAFGPEAGAHARSAIGVQALPLGIAVEIEMVLEIAQGEP